MGRIMDTAFRKLIVIGYGKVTGEVLRYVRERQEEYGYGLDFIEHEVHPLSMTEKICEEKGIPFHRITDKKELTSFFDGLEERTLVISASNNFLFPASVVGKANITIINFHNALLPAYPGRNAPTWAIYMGEKESGITWHYVTAGVDEGNIIIRKRCSIDEDTKAYELAGSLMDLAGEAFRECFADVMAECVEAKEQEFVPERRMYRSYEAPADGFFRLTDRAEDIYRLLRSLDYGKNDIFPPARTIIEGREVKVLRYRKVTPQKRKKEDGVIYLPLPADSFLKIKYSALDNER